MGQTVTKYERYYLAGILTILIPYAIAIEMPSTFIRTLERIKELLESEDDLPGLHQKETP